MAEATVNEIVEAVKEAVDGQLDEKLDEKLTPLEERIAALEGDGESKSEEEEEEEAGKGKESEGENTQTTGALDEEAVKELIKSEVAEATKASDGEVKELKEGLEKILSSRKSIDDEPDGGDGDGTEPASKSASRRDPYGRRMKTRS